MDCLGAELVAALVGVGFMVLCTAMMAGLLGWADAEVADGTDGADGGAAMRC